MILERIRRAVPDVFGRRPPEAGTSRVAARPARLEAVASRPVPGQSASSWRCGDAARARSEAARRLDDARRRLQDSIPPPDD